VSWFRRAADTSRVTTDPRVSRSSAASSPVESGVDHLRVGLVHSCPQPRHHRLAPGRVTSVHAAAKRLGTAYIDHDLVFAQEDGNPLDPSMVTKRFGVLCEEAGVRKIRLHDLRHR
jgi:integrase